MTILEDLEEIAVLPDEDFDERLTTFPGSYPRARQQREDARARLVAMNKARSFEHPRVGTYAARILSVLKHGTQGTAQIAKAVFGKTKNHAMELRRVGSASSILVRLARRGFVTRVAFARWQLTPKVTACQTEESAVVEPESSPIRR